MDVRTDTSCSTNISKCSIGLSMNDRCAVYNVSVPRDDIAFLLQTCNTAFPSQTTQIVGVHLFKEGLVVDDWLSLRCIPSIHIEAGPLLAKACKACSSEITCAPLSFGIIPSRMALCIPLSGADSITLSEMTTIL